MNIHAHQIAELIQGELIGASDTTVNNIAKIEEAKETDLTFLSNPKYISFLDTTLSKLIIINRSFLNDTILSHKNKTFIVVDDAHASFVLLLQYYQKIVQPSDISFGIHPTAIIETQHPIPETVYIGPFVTIGKNVKIGEHCIIHSHVSIDKNSEIGNHVTLHSGVKIMYESKLGNNIVIHPNTIIGSDGFGFQPNNLGKYQKIPQIGNVIIHDDVEIGANTTIDRATMGSTIIYSGVKIDNLVQIAHNVVIGENTVIAAQAGISGSTKIGKNCIIGGQVGIVGHISIADFTQINAQSGVSKPIKQKGAKITGSPAFDYNSALKSQVVFKNLPELKKKIEDIQAMLQHVLNSEK